MTESEVIKILQRDLEIQVKNKALTDGIEAVKFAIQAIDEVQRYREIGTAEECQLAVEKDTPKKVILFDYYNGTVNYGCPVCKTKIISKVCGEWCAGKLSEYCDICGQKLDWSGTE